MISKERIFKMMCTYFFIYDPKARDAEAFSLTYRIK